MDTKWKKGCQQAAERGLKARGGLNDVDRAQPASGTGPSRVFVNTPISDRS